VGAVSVPGIIVPIIHPILLLLQHYVTSPISPLPLPLLFQIIRADPVSVLSFGEQAAYFLHFSFAGERGKVGVVGPFLALVFSFLPAFR